MRDAHRRGHRAAPAHAPPARRLAEARLARRPRAAGSQECLSRRRRFTGPDRGLVGSRGRPPRTVAASTAAPSSRKHFDVLVELQKRRGQAVVTGPVDHPRVHRPPFPGAGRDRARSRARGESSPRPSRAPRAGTCSEIVAEKKPALARRDAGVSAHAVRPRVQARRRLVEADVAVGADAQDLQVDTARAQDRGLEPRALLDRDRGPAVEKVDRRLGRLMCVEQVALHVRRDSCPDGPAAGARTRRG